MIYHIEENDLYVDLKNVFAVTDIYIPMPSAPVDNGVRQFCINVAGHMHVVRCNSLVETTKVRMNLINAWKKAKSK